jgi:hypothetical protein
MVSSGMLHYVVLTRTIWRKIPDDTILQFTGEFGDLCTSASYIEVRTYYVKTYSGQNSRC